MKKIMKAFAIVMLLFINTAALAQQSKTEEVCYNPNAKGDTLKRSIKSAAIGKIGSAAVVINYHSPGVRGRNIWGGLIPYGEVWVTGAHNATNIEIDKDFIVNGVSIPKGKYGFFTIPGKKEWVIIINKNWNQHLTDDYQQSEDLVRIKVKPQQQKETIQRLQYFITDKGNNKGEIAMAWDKIRIKFPLIIKN
ncbi:DUF2911 domain-containing protein [Ferruginibacter sp.]